MNKNTQRSRTWRQRQQLLQDQAEEQVQQLMAQLTLQAQLNQKLRLKEDALVDAVRATEHLLQRQVGSASGGSENDGGGGDEDAAEAAGTSACTAPALPSPPRLLPVPRPGLTAEQCATLARNVAYYESLGRISPVQFRLLLSLSPAWPAPGSVLERALAYTEPLDGPPLLDPTMDVFEDLKRVLERYSGMLLTVSQLYAKSKHQPEAEEALVDAVGRAGALLLGYTGDEGSGAEAQRNMFVVAQRGGLTQGSLQGYLDEMAELMLQELLPGQVEAMVAAYDVAMDAFGAAAQGVRQLLDRVGAGLQQGEPPAPNEDALAPLPQLEESLQAVAAAKLNARKAHAATHLLGMTVLAVCTTRQIAYWQLIALPFGVMPGLTVTAMRTRARPGSGRGGRQPQGAAETD